MIADCNQIHSLTAWPRTKGTEVINPCCLPDDTGQVAGAFATHFPLAPNRRHLDLLVQPDGVTPDEDVFIWRCAIEQVYMRSNLICTKLSQPGPCFRPKLGYRCGSR